MSCVIYTALRNLSAGHTAGVQYGIDFEITSITRSRDMDGSSNVSMDGTTEGVMNRIDKFISVVTDPVSEANYAVWDEFFDSIMPSEIFMIDPYGTELAPNNPQPAILQGKVSEVPHGNNGAVKFSFKVRFV